MNTQAAVIAMAGIVTCLALASRWAWATRLAVSAVEVSAEFALLGPKQPFTQCLWWEGWAGAVWHWGLQQKSGNINEGLADGPSPLGCTLQIRLMQCHMSPGLHDKGGIKAVLDVTNPKCFIPEDCCCSYLLALESSWNAWGHREAALWIYQHCVGVGRKCSGDFFFLVGVNSTQWGNPLLDVLCGLWQSSGLVQYTLTLLNKHRFDLLLYPFTSRNTLLVGADLVSFLPSQIFDVLFLVFQLQQIVVILLFLGLNSADLTVLSNSVVFFFFRNSYRTFGMNMGSRSHS